MFGKRNILNAKETLEALHKKPGMYWGSGPHPFTSWIAFTFGHAIGYEIARRDGGTKPEELVPHDFRKFVTERFLHTLPAGGRGWMSFIREHTSSEQEAFDLFFQLREEYDRANAAGGTGWPSSDYLCRAAEGRPIENAYLQRPLTAPPHR